MANMKVNVGRLRHIISFEDYEEQVDQYGDVIPGRNWTPFQVAEPASVMPISSRELMRSGQVLGTVTHNIECRWFAGLKSRMRIVFEDRIFNIVSIMNPDERNIKYEIQTKESEEN